MGMAKRKKSPCIDICDFSGAHGWCVGCGRTREETRTWNKLKPYKLKILEGELSKRMQKLQEGKAKR